MSAIFRLKSVNGGISIEQRQRVDKLLRKLPLEVNLRCQKHPTNFVYLTSLLGQINIHTFLESCGGVGTAKDSTFSFLHHTISSNKLLILGELDTPVTPENIFPPHGRGLLLFLVPITRNIYVILKVQQKMAMLIYGQTAPPQT